MRFTKVQGLGNDFILVDERGKQKLSLESRKLAGLARDACNRHFGIGADGLVLLLPSQSADVRMRIFNPDGSEAEMCGNAIRCVAGYLYNIKAVSDKKIRVETLAGTIIPEIISQEETTTYSRVDMGEPLLERGKIPMKGPPGKVINEPLEAGKFTWHITALSMGNPHCVIFVPVLDKIPIAEIGPEIEKHPSFPQKTNVEFVQVLSEKEVQMKVWERGAGETLACGTGACAVAVSGVLNGLTGRNVTVHLAGGNLVVEWGEDNHIYMTGPAQEVFSGEYNE